MKKIILWSLGGLLVLVILSYIVLAGFLWWNEKIIEPSTNKDYSLFTQSNEIHKLEWIENGLSSLSRRIDLIEQAQSSIELEFFIFEIDLSSQTITQKLIEAAERGVKVRILVDFAAPVFKLKPVYAHYLSKKGIEVKYYNTAKAFRIVSIQHRSHRKLLIIDGHKAMTGGRNIGDEYFDLSPSYNFLDSDVVIEGPIVTEIKKSFNLYWNSELAHTPESSEKIVEGETDIVSRYLIPGQRYENLLGTLKEKKSQLELDNFLTLCSNISFVTDFPGVLFSNRLVYSTLAKHLFAAESEIVGESPYFVVRNHGLKLIEDISSKKVSLKVLTNSLFSTDAYYTVSAMAFNLDFFDQNNIQLHLFSGEPLESSPHDISAKTRWGTHSKRAVIDGKHVIVGTYNVDPRSANLNSELLIICKDNPELAEFVLKRLERRFSKSWSLSDGQHNSVFRLTQKATLGQRIKFYLVMPLANFFNFLL